MLLARIAKYARLQWRNLAIPDAPSPSFVTLFINSICNMKCEHCFYWQHLNQRDDLTYDEIVSLSRDLGPIENLYLSGGEPFLRKEFGAVCRQFIRQNGVKEIYVPSNGWYTDKTIAQIRETLRESSLKLFAVELSLDGMEEYHDRFRVSPGSFKRAMATYDALVELQQEDSRLQIHSISTATSENMDEIRQLTTFLYDRCPRMSHHNLGMIRGDRKNPSLQGPQLAAYQELYSYVQRLWAPREQGRYGSIVEPMLQWAKVKTLKEERQVIPCRAGILSAVIYANGDVSVCETHQPLDNLRNRSFRDIWYSEEARKLRESISAKECYCTQEICMWTSVAFQPVYMAQAMIGARVWSKPTPLQSWERASYQQPGSRVSLPVLPTNPKKSNG